MADPKKVVKSFGSTTPKKTTTKKTTTKSFGSSGGAKAKPAAEQNAILSAGQSFLDTISTPLYAVEGFIGGLQKGKNPLESAVENATAWQKEGGKVSTGSDIWKDAGLIGAKGSGKPIEEGSPLAFITGLATDIALDPLTYTPGVVVTAPLKAIGAAVRTGAKAAKLAEAGQISEKLVTKAVEGATPKTLKAGSSFVEQYSRKPLIPQNMVRTEGKAAERLAQTEKTVGDKLTYRTLESAAKVTPSQLMASSIEAGSKAAAATVLGDIARYDIGKLLRAERKLGEVAAKVANSAGEPVELRPYDVHVADDGVYVFDGKNLKTFDSEENALAWSKSQTKTPEAVAVSRGAAPVLDSVPASMAKIVKEVPASTIGAKEAKSMLDKVNKLVAGATGVGKAVVSAGQKLTLRTDIKNRLSYIATGELDPLDFLSKIRSVALKDTRSQEAALVKHFNNIVVTGTSGRQVTLGELAAKAKFSDLDRNTQNQISAIFNRFGQDPTVGRIETAATAEAKKYNDYTELINGLNAGDQVDMAVLTKIVKALDPEAKLIAQLDKAAAAETQYAQIKNILVGPGADTIYAVERRMQLVDPANNYTASGLHAADAVGAYTMSVIDGVAPVSPVVTAQTRQAAAARHEKNMNDPILAGSMDDSFMARVINGLNKGLFGFRDKESGEFVGGQINYIKQIMESEDVVTATSKNGDLAVRDTEKAYMADTKAALVKQMGAPLGSRIAANLVGTFRKDLANKGVKKGGVLNKVEADALRKKVTNGMLEAEDTLLAMLGSRSVISKASKKGKKHFVYLSTGDVLATLGEKASKLINDAYFADEANNLDFEGLSNAVRMAIENKNTKAGIKPGSLATELLIKGNNRTWSKAFQTKAKALAAELETVISDADVIKAFEDIHTTKAMAAVQDSAAAAESLTLDTFDALLQGFKANINKNADSTVARAEEVNKHFARLVYSSGVLEQQNGTIAMTMMQTMAMVFTENGRLAKLVGDAEFMPALVGSPTSRNELDRKIYEQVKVAINSTFKNQADHVKAPEKALDRITKKLTKTTQYYDAVIAEGVAKTTKAQVATWMKKVEGAQLRLDAARREALDAGMSTMHRYPDGSWVDSTKYNHKEAVKMAKELRLDVKATDDGLAAVQATDSDTASLIVATISQKKSKEILKQWAEDGKIISIKAAATAREEASVAALKQLDELEASGLDDLEQANYLMESATAGAMHSADIVVYYGANTFAKVADKNVDQLGKLNRIGERISGTSGKWSVKPLLARAESNIMQNFSNVSDVMHTIRGEYVNRWVDPNATKEANQAVRSAKFLEAFKYAKGDITTMPKNVDPAVADLATKIHMVIDPIFGAKGLVASKNISAAALANAFNKKGLSKTIGFTNPGGMTNDQIANYLNVVPFGENPYPKGSEQFDIWEANAELFRNQDMDPFIVLSRMVEAVQFAKTEQAFVLDFHNQFGWQRHFNTMEEAIKAGWVKIQGVGPGGSNLSDHLPDPQKGGLYPPDIAREFMAMNREWNQLFNSKALPQFIRTAMEITGFFKATQTILRPGHHVTNAIGDTTAAMIAGVLNPIHWAQGLSLALEFAGADIKATWGKNKLTGKFEQLFNGYEGYGRALQGVDKNGESLTQITISSGNGVKKLNLSKADLVNALRERNILSGNIFQDNIQGLYESVTADALSTGAEKTLMQTARAKMQLGLQKVEQPFGSFSAYYGNVTRAAHALKVMQSRSWSSLDEALNAASDQVARYHPTIQSLSASERKYPRMIFTYYTWLRVAHNALLDMALNHTGAMMIPSKFQYQQAEQNGLTPTSFGNPWMDKTSAPNYLNYSVYGPTETGPNGRVIYKRSFLPLDVLDTWNFTYDPARTMDQNAFLALESVGGVLGKNINLVAQPGFEFVTGNDPATGKPSQVKDLATFTDKLVGNIGTVNLLKGLGLYTPVNKQPGSANPYTPEDQERIVRNFFTGAKETWVDTPSAIKNTQSEQSSRANLIYENYLKSQQGK